MGSLIEARPSSLLEHLDRANEGRVAVQHLADSLMSGDSWQFIHKKVSTEDYTVQHQREGCGLCDQIDKIWRVVGDYQSLVRSFFAAAQEVAEQAARERAERELTARIESETADYLASRTEFEAA